MKKFTEFTSDNARHIAMLLGLKFSGYSHSDSEASVEDALNVYNDGKEKVVYIYSTGKVSFFINDGGPEGRVLSEINQLPIIDYLRKEGFKFKY